MRSVAVLFVAAFTALVSAQCPSVSISESIELSEKGVACVIMPYGHQYVTGLLWPEGYSGWITIPANGGPPCKSSGENDVTGQC